jgi:hypothetical protein
MNFKDLRGYSAPSYGRYTIEGTADDDQQTVVTFETNSEQLKETANYSREYDAEEPENYAENLEYIKMKLNEKYLKK